MEWTRKHHSMFNIAVVFFLMTMHKAFALDTLSLQDCLREAARNHPDLIAAIESVNQSKSSKTIASSALFPQIAVDARLSTSRSDSSGTDKNSSYGISGEQLIFDGLKTVRQSQAATENMIASKESFRFVSSQVRWRLRTAFIGLLKAQSSVMLTEEIYKIRQKNLELISLRYQSGMEHRGALLTAQANVQEADFDRRSSQRALDVARQGLIKEMGREDFSAIMVEGDFNVDAQVTDEPDFYAIASKHPNLLKTVAQKNAAGFDVRSSRSKFMPTVSVSGDVGRSGSSWPPDDFGSGAGLSVSVPLFEGGANVAGLSRAQSIYRQLQASERGVKDEIVLSLRKSWKDFQDAVDNIGVQEKFMAATEERSKISEAQYAVGLVSFDNWTIIEDALVRQKKTLLDAQANALLAQADWVQAQGEKLEYEK